MALLGASVDYTDKDFDSLRARLINLVRGAFPEWTDFNVANFGNILLELNAHVGDVLLFYQDNQSRESRITTAQLRKSLLGLAKLLGYTPDGAIASTAELVVTLGAPPVGDVTFAIGDTFRTLEITDPIVFQVIDADVTITAGTDPPTAIVTVQNSLDATETFTSTGLPNQEFLLSDSPYLDATADVTAGDGTYSQVDDFLSSTSSDRHFTVTVDENDRATIRFGNGINGAIPQGSIDVDYRTGGGTAGNVEALAISKSDRTYADTFGNPQVVTVSNPSPASGGQNRESIEQIRVYAPESIRVLNRTVAREDYEINAKRVPGVSRALMLTSNERTEIDENAGHLHVIPTGGGLPTSTLKAAVLTMVTETYPNTLTFLVDVRDPEYLTIDVQATVYLEEGETASVVDARIREALEDYFAIELEDGSPNPTVDFGFNLKTASGAPANEIAWSDVFNVVRDVSGVRKIDDSLGAFLLNGERFDVEVATQEFPTLGTVTLLDGDTGAPLA